MPIKFMDYQSSFKWQVDSNGLPIANVLALGAGQWVTVCPCCGMAHDVTSVSGDHYKPNCLLPRTHKTVYAAWIKAHPEAARHNEIVLQRYENETIYTRPIEPRKRVA